MGNEIVLQQLKYYLPPYVKVKQSDPDLSMKNEKDFEFTLKGTDELVGICSMNKEGKLILFESIDLLEEGSLRRDELIEISKQFIEKFHPDTLGDYQLSTVIDLDEIYMIHYGMKDEKLGLFLPNIGFTVSITTNGRIVQFNFENENCTIMYPDEIISKGEAKERYLRHVQMELVIALYDLETYVNGDDRYNLTYQVTERLMDISVRSNEPINFENSRPSYEKISEPINTTRSMYELIGLSNEFKKLGERLHGSERIELWSNEPENIFQPLNYLLDVYEPHMVKLAFRKDGSLSQIISGVQNDSLENTPIDLEIAKNLAIEFIFKIYPDAAQRFLCEVVDMHDKFHNDESETDHSEMNDENWMAEYFTGDDEGTYTFYFHRIYNNVRVIDDIVTVEVGKYSGHINYFEANHVDDKQFQHITVGPNISKERAKTLYADKLEMELTFLDSSEHNDKQTYELSYVPAFPETIGHIHFVDAQTGKMLFVDIGEDTLLL